MYQISGLSINASRFSSSVVPLSILKVGERELAKGIKSLFYVDILIATSSIVVLGLKLAAIVVVGIFVVVMLKKGAPSNPWILAAIVSGAAARILGNSRSISIAAVLFCLLFPRHDLVSAQFIERLFLQIHISL